MPCATSPSARTRPKSPSATADSGSSPRPRPRTLRCGPLRRRYATIANARKKWCRGECSASRAAAPWPRKKRLRGGVRPLGDRPEYRRVVGDLKAEYARIMDPYAREITLRDPCRTAGQIHPSRSGPRSSSTAVSRPNGPCGATSSANTPAAARPNTRSRRSSKAWPNTDRPRPMPNRFSSRYGAAATPRPSMPCAATRKRMQGAHRLDAAGD